MSRAGYKFQSIEVGFQRCLGGCKKFGSTEQPYRVSGDKSGHHGPAQLGLMSVNRGLWSPDGVPGPLAISTSTYYPKSA